MRSSTKEKNLSIELANINEFMMAPLVYTVSWRVWYMYDVRCTLIMSLKAKLREDRGERTSRTKTVNLRWSSSPHPSPSSSSTHRGQRRRKVFPKKYKRFFRLLVSVYEAANFQYQEHCVSISKDYFPLWFTCCIASVNVSLVSILFITRKNIEFSSLT